MLRWEGSPNTRIQQHRNNLLSEYLFRPILAKVLYNNTFNFSYKNKVRIKYLKFYVELVIAGKYSALVEPYEYVHIYLKEQMSMGKKPSEFSKLLKKYNIPNLDWQTLIGPVFMAVKELGGSAQNEEIVNEIIKNLHLPDDIADCIHIGKVGGTELNYRIGWAKTAMKEYGVLDNSTRGVWALSEKYSMCEQIDNIIQEIVDNHKNLNGPKPLPNPEETNKEPWRQELLEVLKNMNPYAFERLAQRILRESGFTDVTVTKKSGDGGIDGKAKVIMEGFLSFNVAFQCKRYAGAVGAPMIRDFRGSLTADIEKGLFITTGLFTAEAKKEAYIAGKQNINLIDGDALLDKIISLGLGVHEKTIYVVDKDFFNNI